MSERFNRKNESIHIKEDRLFPDDFIDDQDGQDADLLQLAADFGCVPCIGSGLEVSSKNPTENKVEVSAGWAYDKDGRRITVDAAQEVLLENTSGGSNYIILYHEYEESESRPAHRTGTVYPTRIAGSFSIDVSETKPAQGEYGIVLANCTKQTEPVETIIVDITERLDMTCRLIAQSMIPEVLEEPPSAKPAGQQQELADLPKGRTIPMPIILSGTRNGAAWDGIETIMPEELGRTTAALAAITLERVNLKSGTPLADVKVWIGDWGQGQRDSGNLKKCNFTMPAKSGVSAWDSDLWITSPPGYYYLVKHDESWYSKITDSGTDYVICEDDIPEGTAAEYYICPYAERYRVQTFPYETDAVLALTHPQTVRQYNRITSPVAPVALIKDLNLGGKYKIKVASEISSENYTKWAEADFIVGSDLVVCWQPASANLNVLAVDGGVEVTVPAPVDGTPVPEAYEYVYTYGDDPAEPDFDNTEHPTYRPKERKFKIDVPPGKKMRIKARAIKTRMAMKCAGAVKMLTPTETYVVAGGVSLRRNRKIFTNPIKEEDIASQGTALADQQKIPNPIWPKSISLFNPTTEPALPQKDFEVYVHGSNQTYTLGRKILIGTGGIATEIAPKGWVEQPISDYRITDPGVMITIKNIAATQQSFDLRYTVEYCEDSESELEKLGQG